ncbi:magnesium transporter CorA family protein [Asticcacaulis sp.]|uniref:magnesium transporter CorA family protein n=1 Tax=Asticcacaulis sp. TaxID=1872648 RepID=UPI003F7B97AA
MSSSGRANSHKKGAKGTQAHQPRSGAKGKSELRILLYNAAGHDEDIEGQVLDFAQLNASQLLWISGSVAEIVKLNGLPDEVKAAVTAEAGTANLEIYDNCYRFFVPNPNLRTQPETPLLFVVSPLCLITVATGRAEFMDRFIETDRGESLNGKLTASALAAALLSEILDDYRLAIASIDREIDKLDEGILSAREAKEPLKKLAILRRQVSKLRAAIGETGSTVHALTRPDFFAHIEGSDHCYFEAVSRTLDRLDDSVARARETIVGSFDLYTTRVAQDTNQLVKALTIATVVTGVIGCAAGVFGMNFDTPFFHSGIFGFAIVTAAMVMASIIIISVAIWRRWF